MRMITSLSGEVLLILLSLTTVAMGADSSIKGRVTDSVTGEPLYGATVFLVGTSLGAVTGSHGRYLIPSVPPGTYEMRTTYIGYRKVEEQITIASGAQLVRDVKLVAVGVHKKGVVVTALASGQNQVINEELASNQIMNAVSAKRIQELPDQNAAESVGRLPGISVLRSGGQGTELVIRGMAPQYNEIQIDGIQMASSNPTDRSIDLSGISSNMLGGIKVFKTVTPNMNADVMGGTVDFSLREAQTGHSGVPTIHLLAQGGYKSLSDAYNKFNNYKYAGTAEERFFNDRFGILAQVDIERQNLTSNELGAAYNHLGNSLTQYITTGLTLSDIPRDIQRRNAALVMDYQLHNGSIKFTNFLSSSLTSDITRQQTYDVTDNELIYSLSNTGGTGLDLINGLEFKQSFSAFHVDAKVSQAYSQSGGPYWSVGFSQLSNAGLSPFDNQANVNPIQVPKAATPDLANTLLQSLYADNSFSKSHVWSGSLDLAQDVAFSKLVNAKIEVGGMYRYTNRYYAVNVADGGGLQFAGSGVVNDLIINMFNLPASAKYHIPIGDFTDPSYNYGKFLGGTYQMTEPLNYGVISRMMGMLQDSIQYIANNNGTQAFSHDNLNSTTNNYVGNENEWATYAMAVINVGPDLTILPGVRYQDLRTTYTGARGIESRNAFLVYNHYDTTAVQNHGYLLPDISLRYKPLSWFDVRVSYTHTLAYPSYSYIIPRIDVGVGAISWNNYKLLPSRSTNYDIDFSVYNNNIVGGLITVGGFWKNIRDLAYPWTFFVSGTQALQYYPQSLLSSTSPPSGTYQINSTINDSDVIHDYGIELDWETHFWYLPGVLSGLVLDVNYSHIFSKAQYPYSMVQSNGRSINYVDTSFTDRLLYQPDNIFNLSLGFNYEAFMIRVAWLYQDNIFTGPNFWPQLRNYTAAYSTWDLEFQQGLPWHGLQLYGDIYNLNGANSVSVIQGGGVPISESDYGATADLGLRYQF